MEKHEETNEERRLTYPESNHLDGEILKKLLLSVVMGRRDVSRVS